MKKEKNGLVRSAKIRNISTLVTRAKRKRRREIKKIMATLERPITKLCHLQLDE